MLTKVTLRTVCCQAARSRFMSAHRRCRVKCGSGASNTQEEDSFVLINLDIRFCILIQKKRVSHLFFMDKGNV